MFTKVEKIKMLRSKTGYGIYRCKEALKITNFNIEDAQIYLLTGKIPEQREMVEERTWEEFSNNGFLWLVNTTLHLFGWAIVFEKDDNGKISRVYPARVKFRGFSEDVTTRNYKKVTEYMYNNSNILLHDVIEDRENEKNKENDQK